MSSYKKTLRFLYGLEQRGIKFGLRNTRVLLRTAGNPHRCYPSIHIAGTNGKGSTASYLASVFSEAGYRTGLYTSPHLVRFTERIRVDGKEIPEKALVEYTRTLAAAIEATHATFFEATTCIAFRYFADQKVDVAIVETGLGGRLDATNLLIPEVSVITAIGFDHMDLLGSTLRSIAREKGGIIKRGVPVVTTSQDSEVVATLRSIARRRASPFYLSRAVLHLIRDSGQGGRSPRVGTTTLGKVNLRPGLAGAHQRENAQLALAALELFLRKGRNRFAFRRVTAETASRGIAAVIRNTGLHGRLEAVGRGYIIDVAHNPDGIRTLVSAIQSRRERVRWIVFGVMKDKEWGKMLAEAARLSGVVVMVKPRTRRACSVAQLCRQARKSGIPFLRGGSVGRGIALARAHAGRKGRILITGSHYVAGEALTVLQKRSA